ncbi:MAG: type II secretion system protein GspD, partial [Planctomycetota bacterium]
MEDILLLVRELDTRFDIRRLRTRIYQVKYLKAEEVAADLTQLIAGSSGYALSGRAGLGTRTTAAATRTTRSRGIARVGRGATTGAVPTTSPGVTAPGGAAGAAGAPALIVPHPQTNSLIIQAEPEEYAEIINILDQIDIKRRQVFLEAALVEVTSGSSLNYTIELLAGEPNDTGTRLLFEHSFGLTGLDFQNWNRAIPDSLTAEQVPPGGLIALMSRGKFPALIQFFKSNSDSQVLATPFILADDNQTNVIDVLETIYVANTSTGASQITTTSQEGEDAGITLEITPTISSKNAVFLELSLEVSQFTGQGTAQVLPPKTTNTITSAVTIPDGEVFVIGGLTRENKSKSVSKVPILGDIPLLGKLFRSESTSKNASNLYIFLRAHVLTHPDFDDGADLALQADTMVRAFAPTMEYLRFQRPQVTMPPKPPEDPDRPMRRLIGGRPVEEPSPRQRSRRAEGYEAPAGPYDLEGGSGTSEAPSADR